MKNNTRRIYQAPKISVLEVVIEDHITNGSIVVGGDDTNPMINNWDEEAPVDGGYYDL